MHIKRSGVITKNPSFESWLWLGLKPYGIVAIPHIFYIACISMSDWLTLTTYVQILKFLHRIDSSLEISV
jgi:hypothetical protein